MAALPRAPHTLIRCCKAITIFAMRSVNDHAPTDRPTSTLRPQLLGFWMCVALVIGNSIGSGIFLLPASLAPFGFNSVVAWGFTAAGAIVLALVFARLSRAFPAAGGPYAYVNAAFGPIAAFVVAWGYWVSIWVGNAAIATGAVSYLSPLMPWISEVPGASAAVTLLVLWMLTFVNWYGVKAAGWVQSVTTILKVLPLLMVAGLGLVAVRGFGASSAAGVPLSVDGVTSAATLTLWALLGLESATVPAERVKNPTRTIPAATLVGAIVTAVICTIACTAVLLLLPADTLAKSNAPFVDLAAQYWGSGAGKILAVFAAISGFGALNGWILLQGELPLAMAKGGVFPAWFARESARGTSTFWLFLGSGLVTLLILANYQKSMVDIFTFMILLSTTACLVLYAVCALALLRLQWVGRLQGARRGSIGVATIALLGALYSCWAIYGAGYAAWWWGMVLIAAALPIYLVFYWLRPVQRSMV
jgi:APA family basic amino acid/polyamine antiporter